MTHGPNLVFVFPDQYRIQALGCWSQSRFAGSLRGGGDPVETPNLDALARDALVLTRATSTAPVCSPFRGMLFTGCYPERSGVPTNCGHDRPDCRLDITRETFSTVLARNGYDCGYIGKYHLDFPTCFDPRRPDWYPGGWDVYTPPERRHGFRYWHSYGTFDVHKDPHYWNEAGERIDPGCWSPRHEAEVARDFIRNRNGERDPEAPFALFVAMNPPHTPNDSLDDCEEEDLRRYADKAPEELLVRPNVDFTTPAVRRAAYYFAQVTGVDRAFGRIVAALDEAGIADDTIVVFTSDHGELLASHGREGKNRIHTECFDVPFLLRYPGVVRARTDDLLFTPVDIMPTLLGLMGLSAPDGIDGADRSPLWCDDQAAARPESALFMRNQPGPQDDQGMHRGYRPAARGIKTQRHTLVFEDLATGGTPVLYDDDADPYQQHPLPIEAEATLVDDLVARLAAHCKIANDPWRPPSR